MTTPMMSKRILLALATAALLSGCAAVTKVGPGDTLIGERIAVPTDAAWNQLKPPFAQGKASAMWTQEGITIDQLNFYVGLRDGDELAPTMSKDQRPLAFKAAMQPHEIVALFESFYSRDGSSFKLDKLEPTDFLGQRGWRANFTVVRKFDEVRLAGTAWGTVRNGELYAMTFSAPAVGFGPRLAPKVEKLASAARFKS
jgi:hypothetical protein